MNPIQTVLGGLITMLFYGMVFAGLYKLFTISSDLAEIKELLKKRTTDLPDPYLARPEQSPGGQPREWTVLDRES